MRILDKIDKKINQAKSINQKSIKGMEELKLNGLHISGNPPENELAYWDKGIHQNWKELRNNNPTQALPNCFYDELDVVASGTKAVPVGTALLGRRK